MSCLGILGLVQGQPGGKMQRHEAIMQMSAHFILVLELCMAAAG